MERGLNYDRENIKYVFIGVILIRFNLIRSMV